MTLTFGNRAIDQLQIAPTRRADTPRERRATMALAAAMAAASGRRAR